MIRWVGLLDRLPNDLLAEKRFAVQHCGHLQVGRAQVEPDARAVHVSAERPSGFRCRRDPVGAASHHFERPLEHRGAHKRVVEGSLALGRVDATKVVCDARRSADGDAPTSARPEQELDEALGIEEVRGGTRVVFRIGQRLITRPRTVGAFEGNHQRHRLSRRPDFVEKRAVGEAGGPKAGLERRQEAGGNQRER